MQTKDRKHTGAHDYSGAWIGIAERAENASEERLANACETVSVGVFKWIPTADGTRLKKSAVVHRVRGPASEIEKIISKAERVCDLLNAGVILKHGSTTVKAGVSNGS